MDACAGRVVDTVCSERSQAWPCLYVSPAQRLPRPARRRQGFAQPHPRGSLQAPGVPAEWVLGSATAGEVADTTWGRGVEERTSPSPQKKNKANTERKRDTRICTHTHLPMTKWPSYKRMEKKASKRKDIDSELRDILGWGCRGVHANASTWSAPPSVLPITERTVRG